MSKSVETALPSLPGGWRYEKLKHVADVRASNVDKHTADGEIPVNLCNYTDVYNNDRVTPDLPFMAATATADEISRFALRAGDVLITKDSETWDDIAVPAFVPQALPGVLCGYHLSRVRPHAVLLDGAFLFYAFKSAVLNTQLHTAANGVTRYGLSAHAIENARVPLPPVAEQRAIAAFLDARTARIDDLIAKKRRLLELLAEKRRAVITRAVTKGLDPSVPMKDTDIPWLGQVPAHWQVKRIAAMIDIITNGYVGATRDILVDEGTKYLQSLHIKNGQIDFDRRPYFVTEDWSMQHSRSILRAGDVLVVQTGDIGQVCAVSREFAGANCHALIIIRPRSECVMGDFLAAAFQSDYGKAALLSIQTGALHPHLECSFVRDVTLPIPPIAEQANILHSLAVQLRYIDDARLLIESALLRQSEYRSALITAAVTGRIEVAADPIEAAA